jgi:hypothetical protein
MTITEQVQVNGDIHRSIPTPYGIIYESCSGPRRNRDRREWFAGSRGMLDCARAWAQRQFEANNVSLDRNFAFPEPPEPAFSFR